ncbi:MAG: hydantoinase B/oxoprolinase family protein [Nitrospinota bacterium]|nr:hydantoinase B/oxoprolinase family protein [Nitrospinota bacterium]
MEITEIPAHSFRFSIDRGGTFTDIYAEIPKKPGFKIIKLLSENPKQYPDAPLEGIRRIIQEVTGKPTTELSGGLIQWVRLGTTLATNAFLERKGTRSALIITKGFGDLLKIGKQNRPHIFELKIEKPYPLYENVVEVDERVRILPSGKVEVQCVPDIEKIKHQLGELREKGIQSLAVAFMHAYVFPDHERILKNLAHECGFKNISISSEVLPLIKFVDRGQTTCLDAYLNLPIQKYLKNFNKGFSPLFVMQSDGGLVEASSVSGCRSLLSGPAGGVVGYAQSVECGNRPVIGFDMGGTSTDVSRFGGEYEWTLEHEIAGVPLQVPQLKILTVAAGGGSRLFFENGMFRVGPESSGAYPGPVCYRNGGPLSLTDANLILGRLPHFPKVLGEKEDRALDKEKARKTFEILSKKILKETGQKKSVEEIAYGFIEVANENMARPIHEISTARGFDVRDHVLACFGGAGGQHACAIARSLGITEVFVHRFSGVLSAYGMGLANITTERQESVLADIEKDIPAELINQLDTLEESVRNELRKRGELEIRVQRFLSMRFEGSDATLFVRQVPGKSITEEFRKIHQREFGFNSPGRKIQVQDIRVRAEGKTLRPKNLKIRKTGKTGQPVSKDHCYFRGGWQETPVYEMESIHEGNIIKGPAIILQETSTLLIEPNCKATVNDFGDIKIKLGRVKEKIIGVKLDAVQLALFGSRFMSIAEQMGRVLQRTAVSTNVKERLDFSCAIFDPEAGLVANAPHQPVHLGAMGEAVMKQVELQGLPIQEGEVWVSNHPEMGGSHLPDITVVTPVLKHGKPIFFVANRGHHADVGGITPGSMPPFSKNLEEEGACIKTFKLVKGGEFQEEEIKKIFADAGGRSLSDNISDLKAQVAANQKGIALLNNMIDTWSLEVVQAYMRHLQSNASDSVRNLLRAFCGNKKGVQLQAKDLLDDGSEINLVLNVDKKDGKATFDFRGTSKQLPGNLNVPKAVTRSAILYCLRCLIDSDIPLNQGCLDPIEILIEEGSLLAPTENAAVVAGNVLTSQRIVDVVFKALGSCAASQGCMNNFTFCNDQIAYYENKGGGAGAGPTWHGQSGVHTHMTNTRITDPEVLEKRYPVLLHEFSFRKNSGGKGKFNGGDGLIREIEFLEPLTVTILSERRVFAPYGLNGGESGAKGQNLQIEKEGNEIDLGGKNQFLAKPGDRVRIFTPGGGAFSTVK